MQEVLSPFGSAALELAARRFGVIPLADASKTPRRRGPGCYDASRDPGRIEEWWLRWPQANIGIATGEPWGFFVLDVDRHGADGFESLKRLTTTYGPLPETLTAATPSNGWHLFLTATDLPPSRGKLYSGGKLLPGLEIKSSGGYVVATPSIWNGCQYAWLHRGPIAEAPGWLIDLTRQPTRTARRGPQPTTRTSALPKLTTPASAPALSVPTSKNEAYAHQGLRNECFRVANTAPKRRMIVLNNACLSVGGLVAGQGVAYDVAHSALLRAAWECGLVDDRGEQAVLNAISAGLKVGARQPRTVEHARDHLYAVVDALPLTPGQRQTLRWMVYEMRPDKTFRAGMGWLAKQQRRHRPNILRDIKRLLACGYIQRLQGPPSGKGKQCVNFLITLPHHVSGLTPSVPLTP